MGEGLDMSFNVRVENALKKLEFARKSIIAAAPMAMTKGMELFLGQFQRDQLHIRDGKVAAYGGFGTTKRTSMFGLRNISGTLLRSWRVTTRNLGYDVVVRLATSSPYAKIHQYGGTVAHPGGTPYYPIRFTDGEFRPLNKRWIGTPGVRLTKPHPITIPKRLYLIESFKQENTFGGKYIIANQLIKSVAGATGKGRML